MSKIVDVLMSRAVFAVIVVFALGYFVYDVMVSALTYGANFRCWNLPNITITFALILALFLARQVDRRMREALHELWLQGTFPETSDPTDGLQETIFKGSARREAASALLIMLVMVASYAWSEGAYLPEIFAALVDPQPGSAITREYALSFFASNVLGVLSGLVAGAFFGRLATYGSMAAVLASSRTHLNIRPGHFDGANGLKPVGDFYLFQAMLTAIPLLWLSGWVLALPWYHGAQCFAGLDPSFTGRLQWQYYGQWLVVACFTYFGFIRPLFALRRRLLEARAHLRTHRLPQIEQEIARLKMARSGALEGEGRDSIERKIHDLAREHWAIRTMSGWPMDKTTFQTYAPMEIVTNVAPVLAAFTLDTGAAGQGPLAPGLMGGLSSFLKGLFL